MSVKLIIYGPPLSGKTTISNIIIDHFIGKLNFIKYSYVDIISEIARSYFGMTKMDAKLVTSIEYKMKEIKNDVWINTLMTECLLYDCVIIDDFIPDNDTITTLMENNYYVVKLNASRQDQIARMKHRYGSDWPLYIRDLDDYECTTCKANLLLDCSSIKDAANTVISYIKLKL